MAYASVNVFAVREEDWESFVSLQGNVFVPLLRRQPGFEGFELVRTGPATGVATLWWASEQARAAATPALHEWVSVHLDPYFVSLDNPSGPVVVSTREFS
ncbi:MAG TPA: antibiotic biosynthesis monooxygenase [Chloroflexota bacterium]|nr:antibiotic biosynthesis monooxygenase [Chloroflexota bacterium]